MEHGTRNTTTDAIWAARLADLGRAVRRAIIESRAQAHDWATPVAHEGGDTIFAIDRRVEPVLEMVVAGWKTPITLIAEGMGDTGRRTFGGAPTHCVIVDPIDGTRNLMYDKRAAWFLAAVVEGDAAGATLADSLASAIVELPTSKQHRGDVITATRGRPAQCVRENLDGSDGLAMTMAPSRSSTLQGGFAQVSNFFPGTKVLASRLMEHIVEATLGPMEPGSASVFEDQYISTGGQMVELMMGRDRFCCDLRPLFYKALALDLAGDKRRGDERTPDTRRQAIGLDRPFPAGLECHPYDVAGLLAAQRAGVIVTDGLGGQLRPPLDVHSAVHWCGYANAALREQIEPVIVEFFASLGVHQPPA